MKNYTKITTKFIEDIGSNVTIYRHDKTQARICTIENDDTNKVFSIAFRTPAINNGGLTHILEHSVLCGSKKYPVKDPFVELLKSSLNTFLNAFTFPDKTMYPCASQNDKDFKNLMSVYMDAVFYPQIYNHEEIFMQEGWHYHLLDENDPITYNGVVYNEMKGAFSDPQQILSRQIMHSLYPDNAYGFESGGDPEYIPDLSYEEFKNFHSKFYHPSNSYIFLYGDCDMEERLAWLDEAYLSHFDKINFDTEVKFQKPFNKPLNLTSFYPVSKDMALDHKTFLSYNVSFPSTLDTKLMIATSILVDVLFNNPGAPLKQALIDAKLGDDVSAFFDDGLLQPLFSIVVVNSDKEKEEEFINLVNKSLKDILVKGLDHKALKSLINYQEFKVREGKFGYMPKGLEIEINCLSSWLYSEEHPFAKLENLKYFGELREELEKGYFEKIIEDLILNNNHKTYTKLVPSHICADEKEANLAKKLADYKASLSKEEIKALIEKTKALAVYQSTPSTKEEINTLPKLTITDLDANPQKLNLEVLKGKYQTLFSRYFTNEVDYVSYLFDVSGISVDDIKYVKLLTELLSEISTEKYTYGEINQLVQNYTGGIRFNTKCIKTVEGKVRVFFEVASSALGKNAKIVKDLILEILFKSNFADTKRLFEKLNEIKVGQEMNTANRGHVVGLVRAGSYVDEACALNDAMDGIGFLDFMEGIVSSFEKDQKDLIAKLDNLTKKIFAKKNFLLSFTGEKKALDAYTAVAEDFYNALSDNKEEFSSCFKPNVLNEGIKTPGDVNYVARYGTYKGDYCGAMLVLNNALSLDYLWMQVRVHGGAYGCMLATPQTKSIGFTSYRDPSIKRTMDVYENVVDYVKNFNPEDILKYKIGAIGGLDQVLHVSNKGSVAASNYLMGNTYELQAKYRKEALQATKEDVIKLAPYFEEALKGNNLCVIGTAKLIEENKDMFKTVRNLLK